jgi:TP901 family phage tail tape measure protein
MGRTVTVGLRARNDQFDGAYKKSAVEVRSFEQTVARSGRSVRRDMLSMRQSMDLVGGASLNLQGAPPVLKGVAVAGAGAAIALGYAAKSAIELDKSMRNVNSISHLSEQQLDSLTGQVIDLSKQLPQSATVLANGLYDIASSGFQGADGLTVLHAAGVAASAGLTDTSTAAQAITAVLNAYQLSAADATDVSDQLFQTVNLGVTNFESLAHNVGDYIGQAKALGISFDQTQSAIAALTLTGTTQMQAGTALGSVLTSLIRPQQGLAAAIAATGYSSGSAMVQALGLRGTLLKLSEATGGSAEGMGQLFTDSQALRSVLQLTSNGGAKWSQVATDIEDKSRRASAAQKALAEQSKSVAFQLEVARNKVDAAAQAVGRQLLPLLAEGIDGTLQFGDATMNALEPLQPLFVDLGRALEHLVEIGGDVEGVIGPVVEDLAKLAAVPVVVLLEALAAALEQVTGLLADHKTLVTALAIAYGIALYGSVVKLNVAVGIHLVKALVGSLLSLERMVAGAGSARAALTGLATGSAVATAGLAAALAVGMTAWSGYAQGAKEAGTAIKQAKRAMAEPGDLSGFQKARQEVLKVRDDAEKFIRGQKDLGFWGGLLDPGGNAKAIGLGHLLEQLQQQASDTDVAWQKFENTVNSVLESKLSGKAQDSFHNSMVLTGKAFADVQPMLDAAGVKVTDTFDTIDRKLTEYKAKTGSAVGGSQQVVDALQGITTGATDTSTAVDRLKTGLDELLGVFLSSDEAAIAFEKALDDMQATLHKNGRTLDINTEKGRDNRSAIIDTVKALEAKLEADAAAGQSAAQLSTTLLTGRNRLLAQAEAAGMTQQALETLLNQYHLTPDVVQTIIQAVGAQQAVDQIDKVKAAQDALKDKAVTIDVLLRATQAGTLAKLTRLEGRAAGGPITGPGTSTSDDVLIRASTGEFVQQAVAVDYYGSAFMQALNDRRVPKNALPAFAQGGPVGGPQVGELDTTFRPRRGSVLFQAGKLERRGASADQVQALLDSYEEYLRKLDQVQQREELLGDLRQARASLDKAHGKDRRDALDRVLEASKRLREFDQTSRVDAERRATDKLVGSLRAKADAQQAAAEKAAQAKRAADEMAAEDKRAAEEQAQAQQQAAVDAENHRRSIADNMYSLGLVSAQVEAVDITQRMAGLEQYSDEWMRLHQQRQQVLQDSHNQALTTVTILDPRAIPGRASGGSVEAGKAYWLGENGPEIGVFDRPGYVIPNHELPRLPARPHTGAAPAGAAASGGVDRSINGAVQINLHGTRATPREALRDLDWYTR